jgi:hypothetical protein
MIIAAIAEARADRRLDLQGFDLPGDRSVARLEAAHSDLRNVCSICQIELTPPRSILNGLQPVP